MSHDQITPEPEEHSDEENRKRILTWWATIIGICAVVLFGSVFVTASYLQRQRFEFENWRPPKLGRLETDLVATNQHGDSVSLGQLEGKVFVAGYQYTECPAGCLGTAATMVKLEEKFGDHPDFRLISISVDPETDTPEKMASWVEDRGIDTEDWWFLTGEAERFADYMISEFQFYSSTENTDPDVIAATGRWSHDLRLAIVDRKANIRGYYDVMHQQIGELEFLRMVQDITLVLNPDLVHSDIAPPVTPESGPSPSEELETSEPEEPEAREGKTEASRITAPDGTTLELSSLEVGPSEIIEAEKTVGDLTFSPAFQGIELDAGEKYFAVEFGVTNSGSEPATIKEIESTCACLSVTATKKNLAPGDVSTITGIFDATELSGTSERKISVLTDQDRLPIFLITRVAVQPVYEIEPTQLTWKIDGPSTPQTIDFRVIREDPVSVLAVSGKEDLITTSFETIEPGRHYQITITPVTTAESRLGLIKIETDCEIARHANALAYLSIED